MEMGAYFDSAYLESLKDRMVTFKAIIEKFAKDRNVSVSNLYYADGFKDRTLLHKMLLTYISKNFNDVDVNNILSTQMTKILSADEGYRPFVEYFTNYYDSAYTFDARGKLVVFDNEAKLNNYWDIVDNRFRSNLEDYARILKLIVLKDGRCFYGKPIHDSMLKWLFLEGNDVNGAIRLNIQYFTRGGMYISGFRSYGISDKIDHEPAVLLSDKQVETLTKIYSICIKSNRGFAQLEDILAGSNSCYDLGFDEDSYNMIMSKDGKEINVTDYNRKQLENWRLFSREVFDRNLLDVARKQRKKYPPEAQ